MSGRSRTIPEDEKLQIPEDSRWQKFPGVFAAVGIASLLISFVISNLTYHPGEHGEGKTQHQQSYQAPGEGHGPEPEHSDAKEHGKSDGHESDGHGKASHAKGTHEDGAHQDGHEAEHGAGHGGSHASGQRFWFSYLTAFMYTLSLALGALFFVAIHFLTKSAWSVVVRRVAENVMGTLPLFVLLFLPVLAGLEVTHSHWWNVEPGEDVLLDAKRGYLNQSFFIIRAFGYLAVWSFLARYFYQQSVRQDESGDHDITRRLQALAPVTVILFALSVTFAAIDWMKSMDPHWYSTMWGVYYFAGCLVGIFASLSVLVLWLKSDGFIQKVVNEEHYHDLGKLLFGFTVFWTYIAFSQYFLIWYANIPEEQLWFDHRSHGGWREYGIFLAVGHFFIPFFFLLPRAIKRNPPTLLMGACWMLFIHYVDIYFVVMPTYSATFNPSIIDLLAVVGVLGLFLSGFTYLTIRSSLIPIKDPRLPDSIAFENH